MHTKAYQDFIYTRTYSRWLEDKNRRENWVETVERYKQFFEPRVPEHLKEEFYNAINNIILREVMPSMRALWSAGPALERENLAGYNCLHGSEKLLTLEKGVVPISECVGSYHVVDGNGEWVLSDINSFGEQKIVEAKFGYNSHNKIVKCTEEHDWVLSDGRRVKTKELVAGDVIAFNNVSKKYDTVDYKLGLIHGIIYGDGTATFSQERIKGYIIRLCNDYADLLPLFDKYPVSYPPSYGGDPVVYMYNDSFAKTHLLKKLPADSETEDYLVGFFRGWFAADGYCGSTKGEAVICVSEDEEVWLKRVIAKFGYVFQGSTPLPRQTNYGTRKKSSRNLKIARFSLCEDDFIIERKRNNFKKYEDFKYIFRGFTGKTYIDNVYCATVPTTHSFVLEGGLLTGNCAATVIDRMEVFGEILYILMCGTGVGFSVERQFIIKLPDIPMLNSIDSTIVFEDSKEGWAQGFNNFIETLYKGFIPEFDLHRIRPKGAPLKIFGGRASGPAPLRHLLEYTVALFKRAQGRKLNSIECHDLVCTIANCVIVGGVRRSATISLSNFSDMRMRHAKDGHFYIDHPERNLANNSVAYTEKPDALSFMEEWLSLARSGSGERGIINRQSMQQSAKKCGRKDDISFVVNPCGEVILRPNQLCNLTEAVIRAEDSLESVFNKIRYATILGVLQATLTQFNFVSDEWKNNVEEERLLGVSLTGICDNSFFATPSAALKDTLERLNVYCQEVANEWADALKINRPTARTTVKPSGTVSQLVNSSSGIHPRYSKYYIRRVRVTATDPVAKYLVDKGITWQPEVGEFIENHNTKVFEFPIKSPDNCVTRHNVTALDQLELWKFYKQYWTDHNPSCTIYVDDSEWLSVGAWVYENWDKIGGLSFLPKDGGVYPLAPYEEITKEEYEELSSNFPELNFNDLYEYEKVDSTEGAREFACVGGVCELV